MPAINPSLSHCTRYSGSAVYQRKGGKRYEDHKDQKGINRKRKAILYINTRVWNLER